MNVRARRVAPGAAMCVAIALALSACAGGGEPLETNAASNRREAVSADNELGREAGGGDEAASRRRNDADDRVAGSDASGATTTSPPASPTTTATSPADPAVDPQPDEAPADAPSAEAEAQAPSMPAPRPLIQMATRDGRRRFSTWNQAEADSAAARHGLVVVAQGPTCAFGSPFPGSLEIRRLKPTASSPSWLHVIADGDEHRRLMDQGWIDEGAAGYTFAVAGPGRVELRRFGNSSAWWIGPYSAQDGARDDGPLGFVLESC